MYETGKRLNEFHLPNKKKREKTLQINGHLSRCTHQFVLNRIGSIIRILWIRLLWIAIKHETKWRKLYPINVCSKCKLTYHNLCSCGHWQFFNGMVIGMAHRLLHHNVHVCFRISKYHCGLVARCVLRKLNRNANKMEN